MGVALDTYNLDKASVIPLEDEFDGDARGILWLYEKPSTRCTYVMSIDPSVGRSGWNRQTRTDDDVKTDNSALIITRVGIDGAPSVQVAEYAAPVDAEDIGVVANIVGRIFAGNSDQGMCLCIIEMYPGPGLLTFRKMLDLGYTNQFVWKTLDSFNPNATNKFGFWPSREANKYLWLRASKVIQRGKYEIRSEFLLEEMRDCTIPPGQLWGEAISGKHDDRIRAAMLGLWAINDWSMQVETTNKKVEVNNQKQASWQASDLSMEAMMDAWNDKFAELCEAG